MPLFTPDKYILKTYRLCSGTQRDDSYPGIQSSSPRPGRRGPAPSGHSKGQSRRKRERHATIHTTNTLQTHAHLSRGWHSCRMLPYRYPLCWTDRRLAGRHLAGLFTCVRRDSPVEGRRPFAMPEIHRHVKITSNRKTLTEAADASVHPVSFEGTAD